MNENMDDVLIEALDLLEQGQRIEDIVARFPHSAAELRPFLKTAAALSTLSIQPDLAAEAESKRAFLEEAGRLAAGESHPARSAGFSLLGWLAPVLTVLAIIFLGGAGLVSASDTAAPGDALYGAKLFFEQARLNLTGDPERAAELRERFQQERVNEIERLLAAGRVADVSLTGVIDSMTGERWTVAGVPVVVTVATTIDGRPAVGALVQVDGETRDGAVFARSVRLLVAATPTPVEATPQPVVTPEPSPTATATPTAEADMDNHNDNESGVSPGAQPIAPLATATTQPQATAPPPPPVDNDNDGGDDNGNDNLDDNLNDNDGSDDNANDNDGGDDDDDDNDNLDDNLNDNDGGDDNANDNLDDNLNDNDGSDDNANDNLDDNLNDNDGDDNGNG